MELWWITPTEGQRPKTTREQTPVHLEHLPAWKQLIMESRQLQTASVLLIAESKRQRAALKQQVAVSRQQQIALFDRWFSFIIMRE